MIVVDDGIATGWSAKAACQVARAHGADKVVLAVPIGPDDIVARFAGTPMRWCLATPALISPSSGSSYRNPHPDLRRRWRFVLTAIRRGRCAITDAAPTAAMRRSRLAGPVPVA